MSAWWHRRRWVLNLLQAMHRMSMHTQFASHLRRLWRHWCSRWRSYAVNLLLVTMVFGAVQLWQTRDVAGGQAPDLVLTVVGADASRVTTTLSAWREGHPGQPVAIHFWADWCPICRMEEHSVTRLHRDWPVMTVAMQSGDADRVAKTMGQRQLPWVAALDPAGEMARSYGIPAVPGFLVVDRDGMIRTPAVGYTTEWGMRLRLWWVKLFS